MAKLFCVFCGTRKGKRSCILLEGKAICSECCVARRDEHCLKCEHYRTAKLIEIERFISTGKHPFQLNFTHEDEIDGILQRLEETRNGKRAARELEKYKDPTSHQYCFARGVLFLLDGAAEEAVTFFESAIGIFPYFTHGWYNLSSALLQTGRLADAYDACQILLSLIGPNDIFYKLTKDRLLNMEGIVAKDSSFSLQEYIRRCREFEHFYDLMLDEPQKAADGFLALLEKEPDHVQCHGNLGICYSLLGRKADAVRELKKALELDPDYQMARVNLNTVKNTQEGVPMLNNKDCTFIGMEFYRNKFRLEKSNNPLEKQAIRELFSLCGIRVRKPASDNKKE